MHESSYALMKRFSDRVQQQFEGRPVNVLDVGSMGVNGTYKELFSFAGAAYVGLDIAPGPNVDVVPQDPYVWAELADDYFDVIVSGQALEHVEFPWLVMEQMARKLKPGGMLCVIVPSRGPQHRFPVDCYRYYPDGLRALAKWSGLTVLEADVVEGPSGFSDGSDQWGDCHCILTKEAAAPAPPPREGKKAPQAPPPRAARHAHNPLDLPKNAPYYQFNRNEVIQMLVQQGIKANRILELGCASGEIGRQLKQTLQSQHYVGIDSFPQAVEASRAKLDEVYLADIEQTSARELGLQENDFDLFVALDVLEHLRDPWQTLADLARLIKHGGHAVFSIPNIQNITILTALVQGKWTYESMGLLDATHLRFFTFETIQQLIHGAGLTTTHATIVLNPALNVQTLSETGNTIQHGKLTIAPLARDEVLRFYAYQYLVIAQRR